MYPEFSHNSTLEAKGIVKTIDSGAYYLVLCSENFSVACQIECADAIFILENNPHQKNEPDPKNQVEEFSFIAKKQKLNNWYV